MNNMTDKERTQALLDRMEEQCYGMVMATNKACQTCLMARGRADWLPPGQEIRPDLCHCKIYEPDDGGLKPFDVAFKGAPCEWYERELPSQIRRQNVR